MYRQKEGQDGCAIRQIEMHFLNETGIQYKVSARLTYNRYLAASLGISLYGRVLLCFRNWV